MKRKPALVLFSGGLDSILAARLLQEAGHRVEAVHFTCPFYKSRPAREGAKSLGIRLHEVPVGRDYFRMVRSPPHGYGANMNPCLDCKIYMLRKAEAMRRRLGLAFLATGEVLGERPMSQTMKALMLIERAAGLEGKVVRPLSGRLLPATGPEKEGIVSRDSMAAIRGRSRKPQTELARRLKVREYPAPAGGCLLTDPEYSRRLRECLARRRHLTWDEAELAKHGRHFWHARARIVVGRNMEDNEALLGLARRMRLARMEVAGHPGPLTLVDRHSPAALKEAARLTARYSDAPAGSSVRLTAWVGEKRRTIITEVRKP